MSDQHTETTPAQTDAPVTEIVSDAAFGTDEAPGLDAGYSGLVSFVDAETREILNLLGDDSSAGGCCGGSCGCSA